MWAVWLHSENYLCRLDICDLNIVSPWSAMCHFFLVTGLWQSGFLYFDEVRVPFVFYGIAFLFLS